MKHQNRLFLIALPLFVVVATFLIAASDGGVMANYYFADSLYTDTAPDNGVCIVIGIDDYALSELGALPWSRDIMAELIETLNADPDTQPAAIGIDVIYTGASDEAADAHLASAIAENDNVVLACSANFDTLLTLNENGVYIMDDFQIANIDMPYELFDTATGHVNAMYDSDGVLRHHLWSYEYDGETVYSLPYQLYALWCEAVGEAADFEPYTDSNGFWYLEYSRSAGQYYSYSVADILYGNYDPDLFVDAVVLVGVYEASSMDYFITSTDRSTRMYGVEYLANVTDAMIAGITKYTAEVPFAVFSALLLGAYMLLLLKKSMRVALISYPILMVLTLAGYLVAYECGLMLSPLRLLVGYTLACLVGVVYHYVTEKRRRKHVSDVFSRYVDGDIIKQLLKEDSDALGLEGKECNIAVMFVDIRGFTTLSEKLTPMQVVKMLNKYLTLTSSCIKHNGGVVDKFIGDATMAFWGAPLPCEDPVYKACQAAMEMVEKAKEIDTGGASFGIGIHYGPAIVGNIGAEDRMDFTAIGDTVNTTQRVESKAPKQTVYLSEIVVEMLGERAKTTALSEKISLKGKVEAMQLYTLDELL